MAGDSEMTEFERRAHLIKPYFNHLIRHGKDILPPPFICEFLGSPSAGKTTIIRTLDKFWRRQRFRCWTPQEGAEAIRYMDRNTPFYNIATGLHAYRILMEISEGHQYDHVLFDRCVFDAYVWLKYRFRKDQLSADTTRMFQEFFLGAADRVDCAFVIICDPEVAIARETKHELTQQMGQHTNHDTIRLLIECNRESYEELKGRFEQLVLVDTTEMDEKTMIQHVAGRVLDRLEKKVIEASV